jgi:hypothetical protein
MFKRTKVIKEKHARGEWLGRVAPFRGVLFFLSLSLTLWGLWVGNPFVDTFQSDFYRTMQTLASEAVWSVMFLVAGLTMMVGVIRRDSERIRFGAFLGFILWLFVSLLYGVSDPTVTPTATNFVLSLLHGWVYMQIKWHPESLLDNTETSSLTGPELDS